MAAYTTIDDPSAHFHTQLYTGTGSSRDVTNDAHAGNFKPDWVWFKTRNIVIRPQSFDSSRGVTKKLHQDKTGAETTDTNGLTAFNTDGFTVGSNTGVNSDTHNQVAWQWKANGGTTSTNTTGSLDSVVQANTTGGFSIVTWTGAGGNRTVGHGLGAAPDVIIVKNRTAVTQWGVWHKDLGDTDNNLRLNSAVAEIDDALWNDTVPTSSVFSISGATEVSNNSIGYCFAEKQGYSKFGKYFGNGLNGNGAFVYTGFKPAWIMVKNTSLADYFWVMLDNKRNPTNLAANGLSANTSEAEANTPTDFGIDFLSNGFKIRAVNTGYAGGSTGNTLIYMAFAENPFVTSTGIPTTAL